MKIKETVFPVSTLTRDLEIAIDEIWDKYPDIGIKSWILAIEAAKYRLLKKSGYEKNLKTMEEEWDKIDDMIKVQNHTPKLFTEKE